MTAELRVTLLGNGVDARKAVAGLRKLLDVVTGLDTSGRDGPPTTWQFTHLGVGTVTAGVSVLAPPLSRSRADAEAVLSRALDGLVEAEEHEGIPRGWPLQVAADAGDLLKAAATDGLAVELRDNDRPVRAAHITRAARHHLQIGLERSYRDSIGSLVGQLDMVTVHGKLEARLWPERGGRPVLVRFDAEHLESIKDNLGRRVEASGWIRRDLGGRPIHLRLRNVEQLPTFEESPPLSDLIGLDPDFTGGQSAADYLREIRGEAR